MGLSQRHICVISAAYEIELKRFRRFPPGETHAGCEPAPKKLSCRREPARGDRDWVGREELKDPRACSSQHYNPASAGFFFGAAGEQTSGTPSRPTVAASGSRQVVCPGS